MINATAVNVNATGTYQVSYTVTDGKHPVTVNRTVNVVDTAPPSITLTGANPQTIECHSAYVELGERHRMIARAISPVRLPSTPAL